MRAQPLRVLITGGSAGIGAAIAKRVARDGARVAILARPSSRLDEVAAATGALALGADLRHPQEVVDAIHDGAEKLGGLDVLINNAGKFLLGNVREGEIEDWTTMLEVNVRGLLVATRAALPFLLANDDPQIINISSMGGRRVATAAQGVYAGTKHAVHAVSEGLRRELHRDGVRVTVIAPGFVRTNFGEGIKDPVEREKMRVGQEEAGLDPDDIADQVAYVLNTPPSVHVIEVALVSRAQRLVGEH